MKGSTTSEVLGQLYSRFCGCTYISGSLTIQLITGPLTEDNFNSLYYLREISGYLSLRNIPQVTSVTLPNLRIIRGQTTLSSSTGPVALAVENSYIGSLNLPSLTEISNGGATFVLTNGMCGILNVNWDDILNNGRFDYSMSGCTTPNTGKLAVMWESCESHVMHLVLFFFTCKPIKSLGTRRLAISSRSGIQPSSKSQYLHFVLVYGQLCLLRLSQSWL